MYQSYDTGYPADQGRRAKKPPDALTCKVVFFSWTFHPPRRDTPTDVQTDGQTDNAKDPLHLVPPLLFLFDVRFLFLVVGGVHL